MPTRQAHLLLLCGSLALFGCSDAVPTGPGTGLGENDGNPSAPPAAPPIVVVDPDVYAVQLNGSFSTTGTSTGVIFLTSGPAKWNEGACSGSVANGTDGTWVSPSGQPGLAHDPRCIGYWSDGRPANNNRGTCSASTLGYAGLWIKQNGRRSAPYHSKCVMMGAASATLTLTFTQSATLYVANDGSGKRILNFSTGGTTAAQLVYNGTDAPYTTGTGAVTATDGSGNAWTMDLTQSVFFWYTGEYNGDVIAELQGIGVEAVACSPVTGCVLTTVRLGA